MIKLIMHTKGWNGVYEVTIKFDSDKEYTYFLTSEYAYRKFMKFYGLKKYNIAFSFIRNFNRKELFIEATNTEAVPQGNYQLCAAD
jgi:3-methyladenine DNA glycosylase AlkC